MKIERKKDKFASLTITIESEKEFKFLIGLFNLAQAREKREADNFDDSLDHDFYDLLEPYQDGRYY